MIKSMIAAAWIAGLANSPEILRIAMLESKGDHKAIGDNGKAFGAWQMHEAAWKEADRVLPRKYQSTIKAGYTNPNISIQHAAAYVAILNARFNKASGRNANWMDTYVMWRIGFNGYKKLHFAQTNVDGDIWQKAAYVRHGTYH